MEVTERLSDWRLAGLPPCARRHPVRRKSARGPASPDPHQRLPTHLRRSARRRQRLPSPTATLAQFPWYSYMFPIMKRVRLSILLRGTAGTGGTSATTAIRETRWRRVLIPERTPSRGSKGRSGGAVTLGVAPGLRMAWRTVSSSEPAAVRVLGRPVNDEVEGPTRLALTSGLNLRRILLVLAGSTPRGAGLRPVSRTRRQVEWPLQAAPCPHSA